MEDLVLRRDRIPLDRITSQDFEEARETFLDWAAAHPDYFITDEDGGESQMLLEISEEVSQNTEFGRDFLLVLLAEAIRTESSISQVLMFITENDPALF